MHITQVYFRAFDRNAVEIFVTPDPLMEAGVKSRVRTICNTSLLQKVIRYEAIDLKPIHTDEYDSHGKRITPDIKK